MDKAKIKEAARHLLEARNEHKALEALPDGCRPADPDDSYRIQDFLLENIDDSYFGWKVGATNEHAQKSFNLNEPFSGRLLSERAHKSPAALPASRFFMRAVECEVAFAMDRDLPASGAPYSRDDVVQAAAAVHPAIEVADSRFSDFRGVGGLSLIADNAIDGAFVYGKAVRGWRTMELEAHSVSLMVNGARVSHGDGAAVLGDPVASLVWLVNNVTGRGHDVRKGELITTGSWTGIHMAAAGDVLCADFGQLGRIDLRFE